MVKLKGIFNLNLSSMRFAFLTFEMHFSSTVVWRQFSTVSLFFLIKKCGCPTAKSCQRFTWRNSISTCPRQKGHSRPFYFRKLFCNFMCFLISFLVGFMQFFNNLSSLRNFYSFCVDIVWTLFGRFMHFVYFMQS